MTKSCFTVRQANRMLPKVERTLGRVFQMRSQLNQIQRELEMADAAPEDENFEVLIEDASMGINNRRAAVKALTQAIDEQVDQINHFGAIVRDIDRGRVDWQACDGDGDIHLCWQMGEPEVAHWHPAGESCGSRDILATLTSTTSPADVDE